MTQPFGKVNQCGGHGLPRRGTGSRDLTEGTATFWPGAGTGRIAWEASCQERRTGLKRKLFWGQIRDPTSDMPNITQ